LGRRKNFFRTLSSSFHFFLSSAESGIEKEEKEVRKDEKVRLAGRGMDGGIAETEWS